MASPATLYYLRHINSLSEILDFESLVFFVQMSNSPLRKLALGSKECFVLCVCRFVGAFGNESYLDCPEGMAIGPNNTLYVASFLNDKVVKFSIPDGEFLGVVSNCS